jgi:hypothetical protein
MLLLDTAMLRFSMHARLRRYLIMPLILLAGCFGETSGPRFEPAPGRSEAQRFSFTAFLDRSRGVVAATVVNDTSISRRLVMGGCSVWLAVHEADGERRQVWGGPTSCFDYLTEYSMAAHEAVVVERFVGHVPREFLSAQFAVTVTIAPGNVDTVVITPRT